MSIINGHTCIGDDGGTPNRKCAGCEAEKEQKKRMKIDVELYCLSCSTDEKEHKMVGDDVMFENKEANTQARAYTCPNCANKVEVNLSVKRDWKGNA